MRTRGVDLFIEVPDTDLGVFYARAIGGVERAWARGARMAGVATHIDDAVVFRVHEFSFWSRIIGDVVAEKAGRESRAKSKQDVHRLGREAD